MHRRFSIDKDIRPIKHCHTVAVLNTYIKVV